MKISYLKSGFSIIEAVVGVAISAVILVTFLTLVVASRQISRSNAEELKAALYLREAVEVARDLEVSDWAELENIVCVSPLPCHPESSGGVWTFTSGAETLEGIYARTISVSPVYRDKPADDYPNEIVETPGILDPDTKKITAAISWTGQWGGKQRQLETYVYKPQ